MSIRNLLARAKTARQSLFLDTCTIGRPTVTAGTNGVYGPKTYPPLVYNQPCQLKALSARELEWAARMGVKAEWTVRLPEGQDVQTGDRIVSAGIR
jgi:cytochrome c5